jgi:predicted transcriptional regulator
MASNDSRKAAAAARMAAGDTVADAAVASGVSRRTLTRWIAADPEFATEVDRLRGEATKTAVQLLTEQATHAVERLSELVDSESEAISLGACRVILAHTVPTKVESSGGIAIQHTVIGADPDQI